MISTAIVDANALAHIVKHNTKTLSFNGDKTGVIFGFIRKLFILQEKMNADQILFAWDSRSQLERQKEYPPYKVKRRDKKSEEEQELDKIARPQFKILREEVLPEIGFNNNYAVDGLEADDIIAQIVLQYKANSNFQIVSRDNDLHQLIDGDRVAMFDPVKLGWLTEKIFKDKWGIGPNEWELVKSIAGCSGDEVAGIERVKEKTAIKFLRGELKPTTQAFKKIIAGENICVRNMKLVKLPWPTTPEFDISPDTISIEGFKRVCKKYNFQSMMSQQTINQFGYLFCHDCHER